jgi:glycolate oxidase FAD binding subunit
MTYNPHTLEDLQQIVCAAPHLLPVGGCTKTALSSPLPGFEQVSLAGLSGILSYDPQEFTFTALAGTRLSEIQSVLAEQGQYLPFDPPFAGRGATLGGSVAAGLNGPGRARSGGVRDFILGVRYVDSRGRLVHGGGNVVKNAAGFDLPKLMVGSLGSLGILGELTFKVFPRPEAYKTLKVSFPSWEAALQMLARLSVTFLDLDALDLAASPEGVTAWIRLYGLASVLPAKTERVRQIAGGGDLLEAANEEEAWRAARDFEWAPSGWSLIKVPITPSKIPAWEQAIGQALALEGFLRRYSGAGQVCWLATPAGSGRIDRLLTTHGLAGLVVLGQAGTVLLGNYQGRSFYQRVKSAMDPVLRFREI